MASPTPLSKANTTFCLDLFGKLSDNDKTANIFYSPFSISSALAMVLLGAGGNTATQMSEVLCFTESEKQQHSEPDKGMMQMQMQQSHLPLDVLKSLKFRGRQEVPDIHDSFAKVLSELNKPEALYALHVANRLFGEKSYQFTETFLENTTKYYQAGLESVDFATKYEDTRRHINSWVEKQTADKIKDLLAEGVVDNFTKLVLVNAIYFKGKWNTQFKESDTRDAPFKINKNETKTVKMMYQKSKFPITFIPEVNCQILELPYMGNELSMIIFLPNDIEDDSTGLEKLEKELTYDKFVEWTNPDMMNITEVQLALPRFKMEESIDMKNILVSMGMVDAFDVSKSDFSGMTAANDLVVSKVVHKAFVEVNEEGTEAAAATAVLMMLRSLARPPPVFKADHPFIFFIRHNPTMSILFYGRYCSP